MSLTKDLTVTVTNESEGITCTIKTVSALGIEAVSINADPGVYDRAELMKALEMAKTFSFEG